MSKLPQKNNLYNQISELLRVARKNVLQSVNNVMTRTYFEIGKLIVEEEQNGKQRAEYGKQLIIDLSKELTTEYGKGFSTTNLKQMRSFYLTYSIGQTVSDEFKLNHLQSTSASGITCKQSFMKTFSTEYFMQ